MDYDREELRRRRDYEQAMAAQKKQEDRLAELKRAARSARGRLLATTRSEQWHRMTLGWLDRDAGYTGEMASARVWLREQPIQDYVQLLVPFAHAMEGASSIAIEVAAVAANLADWTARGDALLLERAKRAYAADAESFVAWQRGHPDQQKWRGKPATRAQGFLIARMTVALGIDPPLRVNRGEAHDWIAAHGGNPRLAADTDMTADVGTAAATAPEKSVIATPVTPGMQVGPVARDDGGHPNDVTDMPQRDEGAGA